MAALWGRSPRQLSGKMMYGILAHTQDAKLSPVVAAEEVGR